LAREVEKLKAPLRADLRGAIEEANSIANATDQQTDSAQLATARKQIDALAARFKNSSQAMMPLGQQGIVLGSVVIGLNGWKDSLRQQYDSSLRYLAVRLGVLGLAVLVVLGLSHVWRKAIYHYIHEPKRRRQLMVLRRFVVTFAVVLVVAFGFFSSFSSAATFVGFLTAGLALALQNVILSVVAYFFLIGRFGLRVGDHVTVSGVTGQVIEIGLVRFFMVELAGSGADLHPTGRVAVWANSMIFQPYSWLKQLPGAEHAWHLASVTVAPEMDYKAARDRLSAAVDSVYATYRESIERQHAIFEQSINMQLGAPKPVTRVHFSEAGCEIFIRYPVETSRVGSIDPQIVRALNDEIEREPRLVLAPGGAPKIERAS
jgi:small-conductance mechanosensitive channel